MSDHVAIYWDYENCNPPSSSSGLGFDIANNIGRVARLFGSVTIFRAYLDISAQSPKSVLLRSELQSSGVSLIDCPHNGRKDVVDKMILVDMLAFAVDHPAPATIILITGDRDYAYAISILKLRKYQVVLVVPPSPRTPLSLENQASLVIDWGAAALRTRTESSNSAQAVRQPHPELNPHLVGKILRELQDPALDDPDAAMHPYSGASHSTTRLRRTNARDLLEPSKHHRSTRSFSFTQEYTTPASPRKSTSDLAPGEHLIPKTPSRSRHLSVSTGSTRARSSTIVENSPPTMEQDLPAKNLSLSSGGRLNPFDAADTVGSAKHSPPMLSSLDTCELNPHDSCPPSSIIIRSPLESNRSVPDPARQTVCSSNCLGSPVSILKARTGMESVPNFSTRQSQTTARPASPIVAATKSLPETITGVRDTAKIKDSGGPQEIERLARLLFDDSDSDSVQSESHSIHSMDGTHDATNTPKSNYSSCNSNLGVQLADAPSCKHASPPAAAPSEIGDSANSPSAALSRESNTLGCSTPGSESAASSSVLPSTPFTAPESLEDDESEQHELWTMFQPLIYILLVARERGILRPSRSIIATELVQSDKQVYRRAGVSRFRDYTALAEQAGIIQLGGREASAWIGLHPNLMDSIINGHTPPGGDSSPTSDPPTAFQSPLLTGPKSPLIEGAVVPPSTLDWPEVSPFQRRNTLPASSDQQVGASRAFILAQFQPLTDTLLRMRAEGLHKPLRSVVGQLLSRDVYAGAGVSDFKAYAHQASEAQLVQLGGVGGHAWIRLHPELRI